MLRVILACHVVAAIGVGPIFTIPLLANAPASLRAVLILLRFGAGSTLITGIWFWVAIRPGHPAWLLVSVALYGLVIALVGIVHVPTENASLDSPRWARRVRTIGIVSSLLTLCIGGLMVLRPGES